MFAHHFAIARVIPGFLRVKGELLLLAGEFRVVPRVFGSCGRHFHYDPFPWFQLLLQEIGQPYLPDKTKSLGIPFIGSDQTMGRGNFPHPGLGEFPDRE